jgi:hypothetical protein
VVACEFRWKVLDEKAFDELVFGKHINKEKPPLTSKF